MNANYLTNFNIIYQDTLFDFTNQLINQSQWQNLLDRAQTAALPLAIQQVQAGHIQNTTEHRQVLHTALRALPNQPSSAMTAHVEEAIAMRAQMREFVTKLHTSQILGVTGKPIRTIVNIGVGGSNLGTSMVTEALARYKTTGIKIFFVANIDANDLNEVLQQINAEETLFLITSKTFTTFETIQNANAATYWLEQKLQLPQKDIIAHHFVGITAEPQ